MKLQHIFSFPYMNSFSNMVFDENNSLYFITPEVFANNTVINSAIYRINTNEEIAPFISAKGIIDNRTLKLLHDKLLFSTSVDKTHTVYVYDLNGSLVWKKVFSNPILDLNVMCNGNVAVTTRDGDINTITWFDAAGKEIKKSTSDFRFANFAVTNDCAFICTDGEIVICDFNGNVKSTVSIENTVLSMWQNHTNSNNLNASFVVTSEDSIITVNSNGNVVNKYALMSNLNQAFRGKINMYGLNCCSDKEIVLMQNGFLENKLVKVDLDNNCAIAVYDSKEKFVNTPLVTQNNQIIAFAEDVKNSSKCIVFDEMLNKLGTIKIVGEVINYIVIDDKAYVLTLDKKSNEIIIISFDI